MKYINLSIRSYLDKVADKTPVPGGGSTAALAGAIGCALIEMVINYTKNYNKPSIKKSLDSIKKNKNRFLILVDADPAVFNNLRKNYKKYGKNSYNTQLALKKCTLIPFEVCSLSYDTIKNCSKLLNSVNENLITDIGCAVSSIFSAFESAGFNIAINLKHIKDKEFIQKIKTDIRLQSKKIVSLKKNINNRIKEVTG